VRFGIKTEVICLYGTELGLDFLESIAPGLSAMDDHEDNYLQMKDVSSERKSHFAGWNKILLGRQDKACLAYMRICCIMKEVCSYCRPEDQKIKRMMTLSHCKGL
jgi:hypothetical protein